jgi:hypothetical protein
VGNSENLFCGEVVMGVTEIHRVFYMLRGL